MHLKKEPKDHKFVSIWLIMSSKVKYNQLLGLLNFKYMPLKTCHEQWLINFNNRSNLASLSDFDEQNSNMDFGLELSSRSLILTGHTVLLKSTLHPQTLKWKYWWSRSHYYTDESSDFPNRKKRKEKELTVSIKKGKEKVTILEMTELYKGSMSAASHMQFL
jgi:hypothetical protein